MQAKLQISDDWMPMSVYPPIPCETYEVKLTNGAMCRAFWSGKLWWYQGKAISPAAWRDSEAAAA